MFLLSRNIIKIAKSIQLKKLIAAKQHSDRNEYGKKNTLLAELLKKYPQEFKIDSGAGSKYVGLTHKPSGFKIHAPRTLIPIGIEHNIKTSNMKERVRVVLPYKGSYLLEKLQNPNWPANFGKIRHIGGGIEGDETPEEAASREIFEELGVKIAPSVFRRLGTHENQHYITTDKHTLSPGVYKASVGSDPYIHLIHTKPEGDNYIGPDLNLFNQHEA